MDETMSMPDGLPFPPPTLEDRLFALEMRVGALEQVLDMVQQLLARRPHAPDSQEEPSGK